MTTPSYYVTIDSEFRDDQKYPFPTDFSVKFKDTTTGTQVLGVPTGANIEESFFTPLQIDPDFKTIDLRIRNGSITNVKRVGSTKFLACGLCIPKPNTVTSDMIVYQDNTEYVRIPCNQAEGIKSFLLCMDYDGSSYIFNWIIYFQGTSNYTQRCSFELDVNNNIYFLFDFNSNYINVRLQTYPNYSSGFTELFSNIANPTSTLNSCLGLFAFTINGNIYYIDGHNWGYHLYSSNQDIKNTESNGRSNLNIDTASNIYVSANINPYDVDIILQNSITYNPRYNVNFANSNIPYPWMFHSFDISPTGTMLMIGNLPLSSSDKSNNRQLIYCDFCEIAKLVMLYFKPLMRRLF
jgi:hypothetical protein